MLMNVLLENSVSGLTLQQLAHLALGVFATMHVLMVTQQKPPLSKPLPQSETSFGTVSAPLTPVQSRLVTCS